jgi:hypothetical protein
MTEGSQSLREASLVAEITIPVEPIRLESGAWIQHISLAFPDGERSLNVAAAYREGSARQQSAELQALLLRLAEASKDEGRRGGQGKNATASSFPPPPLHQAVGRRIVTSTHGHAGLSRALRRCSCLPYS